MPSIDYARVNTKSDYRYVYGIGLREAGNFYNQIVKIDVQTQKSTMWDEKGCFPGEAIFVPHPEGEKEDDGVLLSVVLDSFQGNSFLLILDAADLTEIARANLPHPILFGYHGLFVR
jgi:carotenoid cleavage dioxygenase-like enzyme